MIIQKVNYCYVIKEESVTVFRNDDRLGQAISFNCYALQSRKKFNDFKHRIERSADVEFDEINSIYRLARSYEVPAAGGRRPMTIVNNKIGF